MGKRAYDAIVLGVGGMGSAAVYQLAARGKRVLGLEQFGLAHDLGSSHGRSRIFRQSYWEGVHYVPLLLRAYELWRELERERGEPLLTLTGGLFFGHKASRVFEGSLASAREFQISHDLLDGREIRKRFPMFRTEDDFIGLYEEIAGMVDPDRVTVSYVEQATRRGAEVRFNEAVLGFTVLPGGEGVEVKTAGGTYTASRLVVAAGPWTGKVLAELGIPLVVQRTLLHWFQPGGTALTVGSMPIFLFQRHDGAIMYGLPMSADQVGVKVAFHNRQNDDCQPDRIERTVSPKEIQDADEQFSELIPAIRGAHVKSKTCMYTLTPDEHFVIDKVPGRPQVILACGFSGHGYKFASVIGEILADLAIDGTSRHRIQKFELARFRSGLPMKGLTR